MAKPLKAAKSAARDSKRKIAIPDRYTDEPTVAGSSSSAIPLLNHSDYDEDARDPDEELPSYSDNANETEDEGSDGDDPPPFTPYKPVVKKITTKLGMGDTLTVSHDPHLNTDGEALYRYCTPTPVIGMTMCLLDRSFSCFFLPPIDAPFYFANSFSFFSQLDGSKKKVWSRQNRRST